MFNVDVISDPETALYPDRKMWRLDMKSLREYDENLVKPALLFAERVTLRSVRIDMANKARGREFEASRMPLRVVGLYVGLSYRRDPEELEVLGLDPKILCSKDEARLILDHGGIHLEDPQYATFIETRWPNIVECAKAVSELWHSRAEELIGGGLDYAVRKGVLTSVGWSRSDSTPYALAWGTDKDYFVDIIGEVVETVLAAEGPIMLEPGSRFFLEREPKLSVPGSISRSGLSTPSGLAVNFVSRLSGLEDVGLDEIVDVRLELDDFMIPFRAAMSDIADEIAQTTDRSEESLRTEIDRRWHRDVHPALQDIRSKMSSESYPRQLLQAFSGDVTSMAAMASTVVLAAGSLVAGAAALVPAVASASIPFLKAANERLRSRDALRQNRLFLLYEIDRRLGR